MYLYLVYLFFFVDRGSTNAAATGRQRLRALLANSGPRLQAGGHARFVSRSRHAASASDTQHCHHDGHVRAGRLPRLAVARPRRVRLRRLAHSTVAFQSRLPILAAVNSPPATSAMTCAFCVTSPSLSAVDASPRDRRNWWMLFSIVPRLSPAQGASLM